jgi:hypothetical protein
MRPWTPQRRSRRFTRPERPSTELSAEMEKVMTNRKCRVILSAAAIALVGILGIISVAASAPKTKWAATDLLPLTCAQAWVKSGKSYPTMISIVETLARVSLANRELTFPNTREAGLEDGKGIATDCKADPNDLYSRSLTGTSAVSPNPPRPAIDGTEFRMETK